MSATHETTIWCDVTMVDDGRLCGQWLTVAVGRVRDARLEAKGEGWTKQGPRDRCPHHSGNCEGRDRCGWCIQNRAGLVGVS